MESVKSTKQPSEWEVKCKSEKAVEGYSRKITDWSARALSLSLSLSPPQSLKPTDGEHNLDM